MKIKQVSITGVRGIPSLILDIQSKNIVIFGENGTGKSSFVDALEFFFTGSVSHLDGVQDLSFKQHCPNIASSCENMKVAMLLNPGSQTITRTSKGLIGIPDNLLTEFNSLETATFILRRSQILKFISDKPAGRYEALDQLIGFKKLNAISASFQKVRNLFDKEMKNKDGEKNRHLQELSQMLNGSIKLVDDIIPLLNIKFEKVGFIKISTINELDYFLTVNKIDEQELKVPPEVATINQLNSSIPDRIVAPETITKFTELTERLKSLNWNDVSKSVYMSNLLKVGMEILNNNDNNTCPLCGHDIDHDALLLNLEERRNRVNLAKSEFDSINLLAKTVSKELYGAVIRLDTLIAEGKKHQELIKWVRALESSKKTIIEYKENIDSIDKKPIILSLNGFLSVDKLLCSTLNEIKNSLDLVVKKIVPSKNQQDRYETLILVGKVSEKISIVRKIDMDITDLTRCCEISNKIYDAFINCKHEVVQNLYDTIQEDISKFYSKLHPGEQPNNINLEVDPEKRASADLRIEYYDRINDPRAYLSEGHLDSLGLCILLAFMKKYNKNSPIVVLDDVVTTIDAGHRERVCDLVYTEFKDAQIFITTHDGIWKEQLVNYNRVYNANSICYEIVDYNSTMGPIIKRARSSWDKISNRLSEGDKYGAGNEGRRYLEEVLENICILFKAKLVYKGPSYHYNIQEMLDAAIKSVQDKIEKSYVEEEILPLFHKLNSNKFLANMASHNNKAIEEVAIDEIAQFCEVVHQLNNKFLCNSCGKKLYYSDEDKLLYCINPNCENPQKIILK